MYQEVSVIFNLFTYLVFLDEVSGVWEVSGIAVLMKRFVNKRNNTAACRFSSAAPFERSFLLRDVSLTNGWFFCPNKKLLLDLCGMSQAYITMARNLGDVSGCALYF